jgi:hypothetical protein
MLKNKITAMIKFTLAIILLAMSIVPVPASAADKPEIFVQTGHAATVQFLAMDKNERYLVSVEDAMEGFYLKI